MWKCNACRHEFRLSDEIDPMEKVLLTQKIYPECGAETVVEFLSERLLCMMTMSGKTHHEENS